jgi:phosphoglycolate phosphatase-like HAD superfamily hydrolase
MRHVVWDWNGTLVDDFSLCVAAASASCIALGGRAIEGDEYRRHFARPVVRFYERVLEREISDDEWTVVNETFHAEYLRLAVDVELAPGALDALRALAERRVTQSLLSMWRHDALLPAVDRFGLRPFFVHVEGQPEMTGSSKHDALIRHLGHLDCDPRDALIVGDSIDDADAAAHAGARCVLVATGTHDVRDLEATGCPVATTLVGALACAGLVEPSNPSNPSPAR